MNTSTNSNTHWLRLLGLGLAFFGAGASHAQTIPTTPNITWTGAVDTIYTKPGNWNLGRTPNWMDNVLIPVTANQPALNAALGIGAAGNITINPGARLRLNAQSELDLSGNLTNNGTLVGMGLLSIRLPQGVTTSTSHTIGGSGTTITLSDLELLANSPTTLNIPMRLMRSLSLTSNLTTTTAGTLTLLSTPAVTAFVVNNQGAVVSGPVTVQRAIDTGGRIVGSPTYAGAGYRHYSSPVTGNTVSDFSTTAAGGSFAPTLTTSYNDSPFAPGTNPFPTVFLYNQARVVTDNGYSPANGFSTFDRGWFVPGPAQTAILQGRGYTVNIAGNQLVDFVGTLTNGDLAPLALPRNAAGTAAAENAGFHLLGNPYPAPIDYSRIAAADRTGLDNAMYVYVSTSQYGGYYRAYQFSNNADGTVNLATATGNPVIPVGQAFFVHVTTPGTTGALTFRNAHRLTTSDGTTFQRSVANVRPQLEMSLHSSDKAVQDMLNVYFADGSTAGVDPSYDALKMPNNNGMFLGALATDGQELAVDSRPLPTDQLTIPLRVAVSASGAYTLETDKLSNMGDLHVYLHDKKLGSFTDLSQQPKYTVNLNSASTVARFELVFSKQPITEVAPTALTQQVSLYPSPAKGVAFLELPSSLGSEAVKATLVDALGRTVRTTSLAAEGENTHKVDLSGLRGGVYMLQLHTSAGIVAKRLVVE